MFYILKTHTRHERCVSCCKHYKYEKETTNLEDVHIKVMYNKKAAPFRDSLEKNHTFESQ